MAVTQETIIIGTLGDGSRLSERRRTSSRGTKSRYTIDIDAEPLVHVFDDVALGAGPAEAIRDELEQGVRQISEKARSSTIERRARAARSPTAASSRRYSGGRTGPKAPGSASPDRMFNDSGRLAEGFHVRQNPRERSFTINVPANRLTEPHFAEGLARLVPEIRNPRLLINSPEVLKEIEDSINLLVAKAHDESDAKVVALRQKRIAALKALVGLVRAAGGV